MRWLFGFFVFIALSCSPVTTGVAVAQLSDADRLSRASEFLDKAAKVRISLDQIDSLYNAQTQTLDNEFRVIRQEYDAATLRNSGKFAASMAALSLDLFQILRSRESKDKAEASQEFIKHSRDIIASYNRINRSYLQITARRWLSMTRN